MPEYFRQARCSSEPPDSFIFFYLIALRTELIISHITNRISIFAKRSRMLFPYFHLSRSLQHTPIDIINHKPGNGHSEYGRDVNRRTIDLRLRGTPLVVQQVRIAWPVLSLRAYTLLRAAAMAMPSVRQHLIVIHAEELLGRQRFGSFHLLPQRRTQRTSPHIPELRHLYLQRIHLQRRPQRAEELRLA